MWRSNTGRLSRPMTALTAPRSAAGTVGAAAGARYRVAPAGFPWAETLRSQAPNASAAWLAGPDSSTVCRVTRSTCRPLLRAKASAGAEEPVRVSATCTVSPPVAGAVGSATAGVTAVAPTIAVATARLRVSRAADRDTRGLLNRGGFPAAYLPRRAAARRCQDCLLYTSPSPRDRQKS